MPVLLDHSPAKAHFKSHTTIGDALNWAQTHLTDDRVIVKIQLDGQILEGQPLTDSRSSLLANRTLAITTHSKKDLALTMIGKLAALIEWLAPQHKDVASLLEKGNSNGGLDRLGSIIAAWIQIQTAYGNLAKLVGITLKDLPVRELTGEQIINEFCTQLAEMQTALQNHDLVLLADLLQYEMDGAVANWMSLLESTLAIVDPAPATT